jgi:hypothetical protein
MTEPQSFSTNAEILSLCSTGIIILLFDRNAYKSEVKSCAEEESEVQIYFTISIAKYKQNTNKP